MLITYSLEVQYDPSGIVWLGSSGEKDRIKKKMESKKNVYLVGG